MEELSSAMERATIVGGNACDNCGKTLRELGVKKLDCCSRCYLVYHCSKSCQKKVWRSGHKGACRAPEDIRPGDFMMHADGTSQQARDEWNHWTHPTSHKEGRTLDGPIVRQGGCRFNLGQQSSAHSTGQVRLSCEI